MEALRLILHSNVQPIVMTDDNGNETAYELREMVAGSRDKYLDMLSQRMSKDAKGKATGIKKFEGMHADLLSMCMFKEDGKLVGKEEIQKWPGTVVTQIFQAAQRLNSLGGEEPSAGAQSAEDEPKND